MPSSPSPVTSTLYSSFPSSRPWSRHLLPSTGRWQQAGQKTKCQAAPHLQQVFKQAGDAVEAALCGRVQLVAVPAVRKVSRGGSG